MTETLKNCCEKKYWAKYCKFNLYTALWFGKIVTVIFRELVCRAYLPRILSWKVCKQVTTQSENCIDDWINHWLIVDYFPQVYKDSFKGGSISEGSLNLAPLARKGTKPLTWAENSNRLFPDMGRTFKFSAQESDLASFVGNGSKDKTSSEIKLALLTTRAI